MRVGVVRKLFQTAFEGGQCGVCLPLQLEYTAQIEPGFKVVGVVFQRDEQTFFRGVKTIQMEQNIRQIDVVFR